MGVIEQRDFIRDFVFPLAFIQNDGSGSFHDFVGTAFVIGTRGYALTAAHVLNARPPPGASLQAMFVDVDGKWAGKCLVSAEVHPKQDVGLLRLAPLSATDPSQKWRSPFRLRNRWEGSACRYDQWGYPSHALFDSDSPGPNDLPRPELIFASGYVRRRVAQKVGSKMKGNSFYELSERAGSGCSGGPVYINNGGIYDVIGIYTGERVWPDGVSYAYATNEECFRHWNPPNLEKTVLEESMTATR